jgi:hypothetical protein
MNLIGPFKLSWYKSVYTLIHVNDIIIPKLMQPSTVCPTPLTWKGASNLTTETLLFDHYVYGVSLPRYVQLVVHNLYCAYGNLTTRWANLTTKERFQVERLGNVSTLQAVHAPMGLWSIIGTCLVVVYREIVINSSPRGGAIAFSTLPNPLSSP